MFTNYEMKKNRKQKTGWELHSSIPKNKTINFQLIEKYSLKKETQANIEKKNSKIQKNKKINKTV